MLPTPSTRSAIYSKMAIPAASFSRSSPDAKQLGLESVKPFYLRDEYLAVLCDTQSTLSQKQEAFNKLHSLAPADLKPLFSNQLNLEITGEGSDNTAVRYLIFTIAGVELSRTRIPASELTTNDHGITGGIGNNEVNLTTPDSTAPSTDRITSEKIASRQSASLTDVQRELMLSPLKDYLDFREIRSMTDSMCRNLLSCVSLVGSAFHADPERVVYQIKCKDFSNEKYHGKPLINVHYPIPSLICNGIITADRIEGLPILADVLTIPYIARCLIYKLITLDEVNVIINTLSVLKGKHPDHHNHASTDYNFKLLEYVYLTVLEKFRDTLKPDVLEHFYRQFCSLQIRRTTSDLELLIFFHSLRHIINAFGIKLADLDGEMLTKLLIRREFMTELIQLKNNRCLQHEKITLPKVLGWLGWSENEIGNLMICFNNAPKLINLVVENRISPQYLANLSDQQRNNIERCVSDPLLTGLFSAGKISVEDMADLSQRKSVNLQSPDVYKAVLNGEITAREASNMNAWQRDNVQNPIARLSSKFTSMFSFSE